HEAERVFAVPLARLARLAAPALVRARKNVALDELLVARKHAVADAAVSPVEPGLIHPVERNADLPALQDVADRAPFRGFSDGPLYQRLGATQEPLTVLEAPAARVQAPIDDVHGLSCIRLSACMWQPRCRESTSPPPLGRGGRVAPLCTNSALLTRPASPAC